VRADIQPNVKPAHCRYCARPVGSRHTEECIADGLIEPEMVSQLGGLPALMLSGEDLAGAKLALFIYRLLRDGSPGEIERSAIEAEASQLHTHMEISNRLLFVYAENIANRMAGGSPHSLAFEARGVIEGLLRVIDGGLSESDEKTDIAAAQKWLKTFKEDSSEQAR
jgi:hypothetical protein